MITDRASGGAIRGDSCPESIPMESSHAGKNAADDVAADPDRDGAVCHPAAVGCVDLTGLD